MKNLKVSFSIIFILCTYNISIHSYELTDESIKNELHNFTTIKKDKDFQFEWKL